MIQLLRMRDRILRCIILINERHYVSYSRLSYMLIAFTQVPAYGYAGDPGLLCPHSDAPYSLAAAALSVKPPFSGYDQIGILYQSVKIIQPEYRLYA